jgi:protoporphyrinogen oxidase
MSGGADGWLNRPEELKQRVVSDLLKARVLSEKDEILFMELSEIPYAYVIFDHNYESSRKQILDLLARHDVTTAGRWGGWNYGGMEDALLEGKAAAEQINAS